MSQDRETNLALFIDFDNVALGARDARQRFDINPLLQRLLEKGKIIVKKAYADWHYYKEHMTPLHEAAIELIEIPMPRISGKNSADIRLVVDAMDMCYSKDHIDTFVIVSGDSDFSPLVSKLRENNKRVIGIGVKNSSSKLLINNCDEFIFYDDIYRHTQRRLGGTAANVPADKRELFDFLVKTVQSLLVENRGMLYSSLIKDTMTRKQPDFTERAHGFSTFGDLLDEARKLGLLNVERDAAAGGTWVVQGLGTGVEAETKGGAEKPGNGTSRSSRRRRRGGRGGGGERPASEGAKATETPTGDRDQPVEKKSAAKKPTETATSQPVATNEKQAMGRPTGKPAARKMTKKSAPKKAPTKKAPARKTAVKKPVTKKAPAKKAATKKTAAKKTVTKKAPATKTTKKVAKKKVAKKAPARKPAVRKGTK
jgi:uncharacterized protein (TIGR00288 family)